jgi:hypothetical protein
MAETAIGFHAFNVSLRRALFTLVSIGVGGRPLKVNEAHDKPRGGGGGQRRW